MTYATHHFLVPTDFSADADYALEYATRLARQLQAKLTLLHVIEPLVVGSVETMPPILFFKTSKTSLPKPWPPHHERVTAAGLLCDYTIVHGVPFQVIIDTARTAHIDLIIMGTHRRTGLRHVLRGTVAEEVVRLAPCAVLVTRPSDTMPTPEGEVDEAPRTASAPDT